MSIYATIWRLQFPRHGDAYVGCEWVDVFAQGVPAHVGTPTSGYGYESGDPFAVFLPPALRIEGGASEDDLRAVVFVSSTSKKGTPRSGQEYESPLLVLTGTEYAAMPFQVLHDRLCDALRGTGPQLVKEPVYDVKVLDKIVTRVAREIRLLEQALKTTNAKTTVEAYEQDDAVLGELF